jgi:riboflavin kinase/FMN adenylyltransferase
VYLLDFDGDLYDTPAAVAFVERLRGEQRFEHVEDLITQMHADVAATRAALGL